MNAALEFNSIAKIEDKVIFYMGRNFCRFYAYDENPGSDNSTEGRDPSGSRI